VIPKLPNYFAYERGCFFWQDKLFHDHLKHSIFSFPALQSFAVFWTIKHPYMNGAKIVELLEVI